MRIYIGDIERKFNSINWEGYVRNFEPGKLLLDIETSGKYVGILTDGIAKMSLANETGKERIVYFLRPLSLFGEVSVLMGKQSIPQVTLKSITPVKVIFVTKEDIEQRMNRDPETALFVLKNLAEKFSSIVSHLNGDSFQDTFSMIADVLLTIGVDNKEVRLSHDEIAEIMGRNRVTVSRVLAKLKQLGIIQQEKRLIIIKKPEMLRKISQDGFDSI